MPFKLIGVLYFFCLLENFLIRTILTVKEFALLDQPFVDIPRIYLVGIYYDTLCFSYFLIPVVLYLTLLPKAVWNSRIHKRAVQVFSFFLIALFSFQAHAEWFFWNEFTNRFNFIAVDYLVYTTEVVGNILESYPIHWVWTSVLFFSALIYFLARKAIAAAAAVPLHAGLARRAAAGCALLLLPAFTWFVLGDFLRDVSPNRVVDQLAKNGLYEGFSAFRNNDLDYYTFYKTFDDRVVLDVMKKELSAENSRFIADAPVPLARRIANPGPERRYNVVMIVVESLSAKFLGVFGGPFHITPHLDRIAGQSLLFTNFYATGNRTVRGLEAIALSLPPTPGHSILKRPGSEDLFTIGPLFARRGYDNKFLYGGYGYFDNMNYFFEHNGFQKIDRTDLQADEIDFANVWGVADENILQKSLKEADKSFARDRPFFHFVLTTSNHLPFTFPEGRIDVPSKSGVIGGVKYTDYAIGTFLEKAAEKPWFDNTIFVIVADHCMGGKGKTHIPIANYHIPMIIYAPKIIKPGVIDKLASQMDVAPTLLGLLHFTYKSKFLGKDILKMEKSEERALLGTHENLGFFRGGTLVTLSPKNKVEYFAFNPKDQTLRAAAPDARRLKEAVGYYQYASYLLDRNLYRRYDRS